MGLLQVLNLPAPPAKSARQSPSGDSAVGRAAKPDARQERLSKAADAWRDVHRLADERIEQLKGAILAHYAGRRADLVAEVEKGAAKLDAILDNVDHSLADILADAASAVSEGTLKAELAKAKALLTQYIGYVKGEPLVAHMDSNPFGVRTDLKVLLVTGLTQAAKAIG